MSHVVEELLLLYELSLTLGQSLEPREIGHRFLKTLMARRNLTGATIWWIELDSPGRSSIDSVPSLNILDSIPRSQYSKTCLSVAHPLWRLIEVGDSRAFTLDDPEFAHLVGDPGGSSACCAVFPLGGDGALLLESSAYNQFSPRFIGQLRAVVSALANTLRGARAYSHLRESELNLRRLSEELAESRNLLQSIIDTAPIRVFWKNRDLKYLGCNPAFAKDAGKQAPMDLIGHDDYEMGWAEQADLYRKDDLSVMESAQSRVGYEEPQTTPDGKTIWLRTSKVPLKNRASEVIGVLGLYDDITERKLAENQTKESHDRLLTVLNSLNAVVYVADMDTHEVLFANKYTQDNIGDIEGKICWQSLQQGQSGPCNFCSNNRLLTPSGEIAPPYVWEFQNTVNKRWYHITDRAMNWIDGRIVRMEIATDITDRKRMESDLLAHKLRLEELVATRTTELEEAKNAAVAANMAKSAFLANMSHEIRTPLNAITGMAHLMQRSGVAPDQYERLDRINVASHHLLEVINAVLELSKIEAGQFTLEDADLSIDSIIANVHGMIQPQAEKKHLGIVLDVDPLPMGLRGDATRIQQALLNYAANAIKFTERGTITLRAKQIDAAEGSVLIRFEVQDTGIGISPEILPRLFAAFEQADNSITRQYGGTGLGLAITRKLAQLMGGDAGVHSSVGDGSTFWFTCHLKLDDRAVRLGPAQGQEDAEFILSRDYAGTRVLLVEDEAINREVARLFLEDTGFEIDEAKNGVEALCMANAKDYSIILMDMQMPVMDGLEATRQLRQLDKFKGVPIVAMTANAFAEDKHRCFEAGMDDFLTKPVEPNQLYATLLKHLAIKRPVRR